MLVREIYRITAESPFDRDYPLRDQIRKAAISVVSNIAEGFERRRPREFIHFLRIARGSTAEIKAQLYVALDVGFVANDDFDMIFRQADRTSRMIHGLITYLTNSRHTGRPNADGS